MRNGCHDCTYTNNCGSKKGQCIDYTFATTEQIKETAKELKDITMSTGSIHDYDEQDAQTKEILEQFDKKHG